MPAKLFPDTSPVMYGKIKRDIETVFVPDEGETIIGVQKFREDIFVATDRRILRFDPESLTFVSTIMAAPDPAKP